MQLRIGSLLETEVFLISYLLKTEVILLSLFFSNESMSFSALLFVNSTLAEIPLISFGLAEVKLEFCCRSPKVSLYPQSQSFYHPYCLIEIS